MQRVRVIPTVKVVHVCPPIMVQTDSTSFRCVVQELTGKRKSPSGSGPESPSVDKTPCSLGSDDKLNLAATSLWNDQNQCCHCARSSNWKLLSQSEKEESPRKSDTWSTSYSDDSQQEVTSTSLDYSHAHRSTGSRLKKSKLGTSNRLESSESKSSTPKLEEAGALGMIKIDMMVSELFSREEALDFAPTLPGSSPASPSSTEHYSSVVAAPDIFSDLYNDLEDDLHKLEYFLLS